MKYVYTGLMACLFICQPGLSQDYLVYPDSSFRVVTLQNEYTPDAIVRFIEKNKPFRINRSELIMLIESHKMYKTFVYRKNETTKGFLYQILDQHIILLQFTSSNKLKTVKIPIEDVELLAVKRHGGKGALIGAACGVVGGAVIGFAMGDTEASLFDNARTASGNAALGAFLLAIDGAIIGGIIGSRKMKIHVKGHVEEVEKYRSKLNQFSIVNEQVVN